MARALTFAVTIALSLNAPTLAAQTGLCVKVDGMIGGPIVTTPEAARKIYRAIVLNRGDKILPTNNILVRDEGDHWSAYQYPAHLPPVRVVNGMTAPDSLSAVAVATNVCPSQLVATGSAKT